MPDPQRPPRSYAGYEPDPRTAQAVTQAVDAGGRISEEDRPYIDQLKNLWSNTKMSDGQATLFLAGLRGGKYKSADEIAQQEPKAEPSALKKYLLGPLTQVGETMLDRGLGVNLIDRRTPEQKAAGDSRTPARALAETLLPQTGADLAVDLSTLGLGGRLRPLTRMLLTGGAGAVGGGAEAALEGGSIPMGAAQGAGQGVAVQGAGEAIAKVGEVGQRIFRRPPQDVPTGTNVVKDITGTQLPLNTADDLIKFAAGRGDAEAHQAFQNHLGLLKQAWMAEPNHRGLVFPADVPSLWKAYGLAPGTQLRVGEALDLFSSLGPQAFKDGALKGARDSGQIAQLREAAKKELTQMFDQANMGDVFSGALENYSRFKAVERVLQTADPAKFTRPDGSIDMLRMRAATIDQLKDLDKRLKPEEVDAVLDWITREGPLAKQDVPSSKWLNMGMVPIPRQLPSYVGRPFQTSPSPFTAPLVPLFGEASRQVYPREREPLRNNPRVKE